MDRCIKSIQNQELHDIEIILIDDGSTDESLNICQRIAKKDSRIKILHQNNAGVSAARNTGLEHASGDYIHFVDSDDFLCTGFYNDCYDKVIKQNIDIYCCTTMHESAEGEYHTQQTNSPESIWNVEEAITQLLYSTNLSYSLCDKIFKRTIIKNIRLNPEIYHNEDFLFNYQAIKSSKRIFFTPKAFYNYCYTPGSAVNSAFNKKKMTAIKAQTIVYQEILEKSPSLAPIASSQYFKVVLYLARQITQSFYNDKEDRASIRKIIRKNIITILKSDLATGYKLNAVLLIIGWKALKEFGR